MKKFLLLILALSVMALAACGDDSAEKDKDEKKEDTEEVADAKQSAEVSDKEKVKEDDVVASINGTEIKGAKYNSIYSQLKMQLSNTEQDISDLDLLKDNTLDVLVKQELIKQESEKAGLEVTEEEVDSEIEMFKTEIGDEFDTVLKENDLTEESLKEQLTFELLTEKYINTEFTDVEVTDEEVEEYYAQVKEQQGEEAPKLEEVEESIKEGLTQQKRQEEFQKKIVELEEKAEIEHLI